MGCHIIGPDAGNLVHEAVIPIVADAMRLGLGQATVKTHVSHLFHKLHVHHRVQIVIAAYECGLVQPGQQDPDSAQH